MICCIGLFIGFAIGQALGIGPILAPVGFLLGLAGDVTTFRLLGRRGEKKIERRTPSFEISHQHEQLDLLRRSCCFPREEEKEHKR